MDTFSEEELKEVLCEMKQGEWGNYTLHDKKIINSMVHHIGSTNRELRDQLIYTMFFRLIVERKQIDAETMSKLLETSLEEFLFKGIEDGESDTVFTRAFTTLLIALILNRNVEEDFLSDDQIYRVQKSLIDYVKLEQDTRGYVNVKGWVHSIAHAADAFDELVANPKVSKGGYPEMTEALWNKVMHPRVYLHDEEERLIQPMLHMLDRGMDPELFKRLLNQLPQDLELRKSQLDGESYWFMLFNVKVFLKSFYIRLKIEDRHSDLQQEILERLKMM